MSDFFYKERITPVFSPVISVKHEKISPTVISAIDNLLSPAGNMFTRAETVKKLMSVEKMSVEQTAKALSLKPVDIAGKLRLLEFSVKERAAILEYGFSESAAIEFLHLDKVSRLYAIEYCRKCAYDDDGIREYVAETVKAKNAKKQEFSKKKETVRKFVVNDIGFLFNSIENVLKLARNAGFEVENKQSENDDFYDIHITVKKQNGK